VNSPRTLTGIAQVGTRTRAHVTWGLELNADGTSVTLSASVEQASPLDRLLLAAGGRAWLESRFERILSTLAERFEEQ
jgi:hypothetical protein